MIPSTITLAIEKLRNCFGGGYDVLLFSKEMYRTEPSQYYKLGRLGVDIYVEGKVVFLGCESDADEMVGPWGQMIVESYMHRVLADRG